MRVVFIHGACVRDGAWWGTAPPNSWWSAEFRAWHPCCRAVARVGDRVALVVRGCPRTSQQFVRCCGTEIPEPAGHGFGLDEVPQGPTPTKEPTRLKSRPDQWWRRRPGLPTSPGAGHGHFVLSEWLNVCSGQSCEGEPTYESSKDEGGECGSPRCRSTALLRTSGDCHHVENARTEKIEAEHQRNTCFSTDAPMPTDGGKGDQTPGQIG